MSDFATAREMEAIDMDPKITLRNPDGSVVSIRRKQDRVNWTLSQLINAGERGCTPITHPAPRWSDYVFKLRGMGVEIETIHESHGGEYPGHHGRYVLRAVVISDDAEAA